MGEFVRLLDCLLHFTIKSKIKFVLAVVCIYKTIRGRLLEEEEEDKEFEKYDTIREKRSRQDASKSPFHAYDILGPMASAMKIYLTLSTLGHSINIIVTSILIYNDLRKGNSVEDNTNRMSAILCHMPRFFVHRIMGPRPMAYLGFTFSFMVLLWRGAILLYQHRLRLDTFTYLMLNDNVVQSNLDHNETLKSYIDSNRLNLAQRVMFYKVQTESDNTIGFGLRPNRTPEARKRLSRVVHGSFQSCTIAFLVTMSAFIPLIAWTAFYDIDFFYPNCYPTNSHLATAIKIIFSIALSTTIMLDCIGVDMYALFLNEVLVCDLKIYWNKIKLELDEMNCLMRKQRYLHGDLPIMEVDERRKFSLRHRQLINSLNLFENCQFLSSQRMEKKQRMSVQLSKIGSFIYLTDHYSTFELRKRIYVFQMVMGDFFAKLAETDEYVSLSLGVTFLIWLVVNGVISYIGLELNTSATSILIRFIQSFTFLIFCLMSAMLLSLKHSIDPAYKTINSIMANDQSLEKIRWLAILGYYTGIPRHSFTIFHSGVFTLLIFFQSFSYTLTFAIYMYSLRAQTPESVT